MSVRTETRNPDLAAQAATYAAVHADHGSYRFLCAGRDGVPFFAHTPVGRVLYHWD